MQIEATFSILSCFSMVFARNPTRPGKSEQTFQFWSVFEWCFFARNPSRIRKSKQTFQFWPGFEWFLLEVLPDPANRSNHFNFDPLLNGFCRKCYWTMQIEATFSVLTRLWMAFAGNPTRRCKSKQTFQFWSVFEWFLQKIQLGFPNRSKLFKFDPFLNGFCKKSY